MKIKMRPRKNSFSSHWTKNFILEPPQNFEEECPIDIKTISSWVHYNDAPYIWTTITLQDKINMENFYCSKCNEWRVISGSIFNVKRHIEYHRKDDEIENSHQVLSLNSEISSEREKAFKYISKQLKKFILLNGYPFSAIEDEFLRAICPLLPSREDFAKQVEDIAKKTENGIKECIKRYKFISIAFDEWTDLLKRRYLGIVANAVSENTTNMFILGLTPISNITATGEHISKLIMDSLERYDIKNRVRVGVTDSGSNMISSFDYLTFVHSIE